MYLFNFKKAFLRLLLLPLLFIFSFQTVFANSTEDTLSVDVFRTLPDHKSLKTSPQFIVVDDFNSGKIINEMGSLWQTEKPREEALKSEAVKSDARNSLRGYSLNLSFKLKANEKAVLESTLNRLDVSQAKHFVFKCRQNGFDTARLRVAISDFNQKTSVRDVTASCAEGEQWSDVIVSLNSFSGLDLDQLYRIRFILMSKQEPVQGSLDLDEIAFFGFNDVGFESNRDNLIGFPKIVYDENRRDELLKMRSSKKLLKEIARDTWRYFENAKDNETHLIVDHIRMGDGSLAASYTSPTNIAVDILSTIGAYDLKFISKENAIRRIRKIFDTLHKLERFNGFFYNFYDTKELGITRSYISSVDSGWLAISLVVLRQAFKDEYWDEATQFLDEFHFSEFLDQQNNQLVVGFDVPKREFGNYHYGMLNSEARATSFYAIGKGDLPKEHWWFLYRTLPQRWEWQNQVSRGERVMRDGVDYFQGYYMYGDKKFVPSWGGSLFEALMPTLVIDEKGKGKKGLGLNNKIFTEIHRDYALIEKEYPVWGISPAATSSGRSWSYEEFGIKELSAKGYRDRAIITPHVSFLALETLPKDAIKNIRNLLKFPNIYGEYGFYDTVNLRNNRVNPQYLALDQGMSFVALVNYLDRGAIQKRFHKDPIGKNAEDVLEEHFFSSN